MRRKSIHTRSQSKKGTTSSAPSTSGTSRKINEDTSDDSPTRPKRSNRRSTNLSPERRVLRNTRSGRSATPLSVRSKTTRHSKEQKPKRDDSKRYNNSSRRSNRRANQHIKEDNDDDEEEEEEEEDDEEQLDSDADDEELELSEEGEDDQDTKGGEEDNEDEEECEKKPEKKDIITKRRNVTEYPPLPDRKRSTVLQTENKWNFGPSATLNRRRRNELYLEQQELMGPSTSRKTVEQNDEDGTIIYEMEAVHPFVICRLCDGYIIDATTVIDCMHTFCKSCLLLHFEDDNNTCPTCGILIHGSHPAQYVTFDRAINELVLKLVPELERNEKERRKQFLRKLWSDVGVDRDKEEEVKKQKQEEERKRGTNRCYRGPGYMSHHRDDHQVVVKLIPGCKDLPLPSRPFLRTSEMTTMNSIKKYLALSLFDDQSKYMNLDIFCDNQLMGKDFSIRFVWMMKRRNQPKTKPLELNYKFTEKD